MRTLAIITAGAVLIVVGFLWLNDYIYDQKQGGVEDFREVEFYLSGEMVRLVEGAATTQMTMGSTTPSTVRYFGNEAKGDLNGDGLSDMAFLITQESTSGETFFYAVGAIQNFAGRYQGTDAVLIGDRIAPQTTEIRSMLDGAAGIFLIVNYADRAPGEPMTAQPSVGSSLYLKLDPQTLSFGELVQDFEGESR